MKRPVGSSISQERLITILLTFLSLLWLAGCNPLKGFQLQSSCSTNCQTVPPPPEFLYATSTDQILTFTIDESSGALNTPLMATGPTKVRGWLYLLLASCLRLASCMFLTS